MALMLLAYLGAILCKEDSVLLPGVAVALATTRWGNATREERRTWSAGILSVLAVGVLYTIFRTLVLATPQIAGNRYTLTLGPHVGQNLTFFAWHLGALPLSMTVLARLQFPFAFTPAARQLPEWGPARARILAGLAWSAVACLLYLPIPGRPAYGYLYGPGFGIAFAVGHALAFAARTQPSTARRRSPLVPLAVHALLAISLTATVLMENHWHQFGAIQRAAIDTLRREVPDPPPGALFVFLDPGVAETPSGRSLFSLVFEGATTSMLRLITALYALKLVLEARTRPDERGSVTTEHVLWAVAVIAIVAIVVTAVRTYVTTQAGNIQ